MKAIVKRPYFDDLGLHKIGDEVEVAAITPLVEVVVTSAPTKKTPKKSKEEKETE